MVFENEELAKPTPAVIYCSIFPKKFINTYRHWMTNIRDWNISSIVVGATDSCLLLWAWKQDFVVAVTKDDALEKAL